MNRYKKLALLSMIIFIAVFSLTAVFGTQLPLRKSKDKSNRADQAMKTISVTPVLKAELREAPEEQVIHSFSYDVDISTNTDQSTNYSADITQVPGTDVTPTPELEEKSKYADIGISVAKDFVNIRAKASTNSTIVGKLYKNSACEIKKKKGSWYYIESGTVKGYVKSDFIKTGLSDQTLIEKYGTLSISVDCDGLNVRMKPTTDSKKVSVVYKDEVYPVMKQSGKWLKVKIPDDHVSGYVKKEFTDLIVEFKEAISSEEEKKLEQLKKETKEKKEQPVRQQKARVKKQSSVSYNYSELQLLTCLIQAEAGYQSYETKLAVANVVLNRMRSSCYPHSMKAVIYQPSQFTVAASGSLQKQLNCYKNFSSSAQLLSKKAAKDALAGSNNIGSRMHFNSYGTAVRCGKDHNSGAMKLGGLLFW